MKQCAVITGLIALVFVCHVFSQFVPPPPTKLYYCEKAENIKIDGSLNEPSWQMAELIFLVNAKTGATPKWPTKIQSIWDSTYFYIAYTTFDDDVWFSNKTGFDSALFANDEPFELVTNFKGDTVNYQEMQWNCVNTVLDIFYPYRGYDWRIGRNWDLGSGMKSAITVLGTINNQYDVDWGMTLEIGIPWVRFDSLYADTARGLFLPPKNGDTLRLQLCRYEKRRDGSAAEGSVWAQPVGAVWYHQVETWGAFIVSDQLATKIHRPYAFQNSGMEELAIFPVNGAEAMRFQYQIPFSSNVSVQIYSPFGQKIITLVDKMHPSGAYSIFWDGRNHFGKKISRGNYFIQIENGMQKKAIQIPMIR